MQGTKYGRIYNSARDSNILYRCRSLADRAMCTTIGWLLQRTTSLGQQGSTELLQVTDGYSVAEHSVITGKHLDGTALEDLRSDRRQFLVLGIAHDDGRY